MSKESWIPWKLEHTYIYIYICILVFKNNHLPSKLIFVATEMPKIPKFDIFQRALIGF